MAALSVDDACREIGKRVWRAQASMSMRSDLHVGHVAVEDRDLAVAALGMRLCGYLCPECHTWAEDMTPHCFNEHADDPVPTLPFYLDDRKAKA